MHQPRPYGLHVKNGELTTKDQAFIDNTAQRLTNLKEVLGVDSLKRAYELPDGGTVIVQDMGGNFRVIADKTPKLYEDDPSLKYGIPMLLSGVISSPIIEADKNVVLNTTYQTRLRLVGYTDNKVLQNSKLEFRKLAIEYDNKFKYFEPKDMGIMLYTQYHKLQPTWYSGAMASLVQVIAGYGRPLTPEDKPTKWDLAKYRLPENVTEAIDEELKSFFASTAFTGEPANEGKIEYSYGATTHAVGFSDNQCFLIEVSQTGVFVMPLPIIPATTTKAFRDYIEKKQDTEIIAIVDKFGGLPTGELMPTGAEREAWVRAGHIQRLCDTHTFYRHTLFYDACGWSFNSTASEGFNTCWSFDDSGMRWAYGFKLSLKLSDQISKPLEFTDDEIKIVGEFMSAFEVVLSSIGNTDYRVKAIRYKLAHMDKQTLVAQATARNINFEYWDKLEVSPKNPHSGILSQTTSGKMYWGSKDKPQSFGYLKFPTFDGAGCQSFDMTLPDYEGGFIKCDTVVFGCYVNDSLKVIKYFIDETKFHQETQSNFEEAMIIGQWEETSYSGDSRVVGYLYTSDFDDRAVVSDSQTYTTLEGKDLGYGQPAYSTPGLLVKWGGLSRARYYTHKKTVTTKKGGGLNIGVCVPVMCRDCILYAHSAYNSGGSYHESLSRLSVADPTSYDIWTYDPVFHYMGAWGFGEPRPTKGEYVYANYFPKKVVEDAYYQYAYSGNWFGVSEGGYRDISGVVSKYTYRDSPYGHNAMGVTIGGEAPQVATYTINKTTLGESKGAVSISLNMLGSVKVHIELPDGWYYAYSPVDAGGNPHYFYREAQYNAFGIAYASTNEHKQSQARTYWGKSQLTDNKVRPYFIGVVNE